MKKATKREVRDAVVMRVAKYASYPVRENGVVEREKVISDMLVKAFAVIDAMIIKKGVKR